MNWQSSLKRGALRVMRGAGLVQLAEASTWRRNRLAILCYHSLAVLDEHLWAPALFISAEHFEARLRWLSQRGYQVLGLDEGLELMRRSALPPKAVAITFDDGTADFASLAWPLLEKYRMPATVYLTTYYVERRKPVFGMLCDYLLWRGRELSLTAELWGSRGQRRLGSWPEREAVLGEIAAFCEKEKLSLGERESWAESLAVAVGVDYADMLRRRMLQIMTPDEVSMVARNGADVQLHTHRHRTPVEPTLFRQEIEENRERIESYAGLRAKHFCYPSGKMAAEFFPWLESLGVESAVTCESGLASRASHRYLLPRIVDTSTLSEVEFEAWLSGARLFLGQGKQAGEIIGRDPGKVG